MNCKHIPFIRFTKLIQLDHELQARTCYKYHTAEPTYRQYLTQSLG